MDGPLPSYCKKCGYDLSGLWKTGNSGSAEPPDHCPECGQSNPALPAPSFRLPWRVQLLTLAVGLLPLVSCWIWCISDTEYVRFDVAFVACPAAGIPGAILTGWAQTVALLLWPGSSIGRWEALGHGFVVGLIATPVLAGIGFASVLLLGVAELVCR